MTDPNSDPFAHRAALVDEDGKKQFGEMHWRNAILALEKGIQSGSITQADIINTINRPNPTETIFYTGIAEADEEHWRLWRDGQPHRRERIKRTEG